MRTIRFGILILVLHACIPGPPAVGQSKEVVDSVVFDLTGRSRRLEKIEFERVFLSGPAATANVPSAFGGRFGEIGVGVVVQQRTRFTNNPDAAMGIVLALGEPHHAIGLDLGTNILDTSRRGAGHWGKRGSFSLKVHRQLASGAAVAIGIENTFVWGGSDAPTSRYAVVSGPLRMLGQSYATLGVASGRYVSLQRIERQQGGLGVFGSIGTRVNSRLGTVIEWGGQDLNLGISWIPLRRYRFVIAPTLVDATGRTGDAPRLMVGAGFGLDATDLR